MSTLHHLRLMGGTPGRITRVVLQVLFMERGAEVVARRWGKVEGRGCQVASLHRVSRQRSKLVADQAGYSFKGNCLLMSWDRWQLW